MVEIKVKGEFNAALENKFNKDISALKEGEALFIDITSKGGHVGTLKSMASTISDLKDKGHYIATYVSEYADSCGFFFFLLGDEGARDIDAKATVHYHPPSVEMKDFQGTRRELGGIYERLSAYQDFTSALFKASCKIDDELFSILENSELPMDRENLISLGIINN